MTSRVPQLLLTLTPQGELAVELPGHQATRRQVVLRTAEAGASLLRMLEAQARQQCEIGLDGAPTERQVRHWERHETWPDSHCRFCLAEGRAKPDFSPMRAKRRELLYKTPAGVEVRVIKTGAKGPMQQRTRKSAEDLGL